MASFEFNLDYIKTNTRAKIITAEAACALLGGILAPVESLGGTAGPFLSFVFWTTFLISGLIVLLNICNVYEKIYLKFGNVVVQSEQIYIGVWAVFYAIATIVSFFGWGASNLIAYVEIILFIVDGYFHYKNPRFASDSPESLPDAQGDVSSFSPSTV